MIIEISIEDLKSMLKMEVSTEDLVNVLAMYGTPPDGVDGDKLFLEVFPNRPDMLSVEGVARAIRGILGTERGYRLYVPYPSSVTMSIDSSAKSIRPYCSAAIVRGVELNAETVASLMQLQEKLHGTHGRKRRKVSIGVMDLDKCRPPFVFSAIKASEIRFRPLGASGELSAGQILTSTEQGRDYRQLLDGYEAYPLIYDSDGRVLSMPPIINSEDTKVDADSRNLFIEAEGWDARAVEQAVFIIATSLAERGAKIEQVKILDELGARNSPSFAPRSLELSADYCNRMLGRKLSATEIKLRLEMMRFEAVASERGVRATIPPYRTDIMHPIDLVEDVAIAYGYGNFEPRISLGHSVGGLHNISRLEDRARLLMVGCGFEEIFTYTMTNQKKLFENVSAQPRHVVTVANPKSEEFTILRDALLPSVVAVLGANTHNPYPQKLFEVAPATKLDASAETGAVEEPHLAACFADARANFSQIKSLVSAVCSLLGKRVSMQASSRQWYTQGRQADIICEGKLLGHFGEIAPQVLLANGIEMPCAAFEIFL